MGAHTPQAHKLRPHMIEVWDDERDLGHGWICNLVPSWTFDPLEHLTVMGFDTKREAWERPVYSAAAIIEAETARRRSIVAGACLRESERLEGLARDYTSSLTHVERRQLRDEAWHLRAFVAEGEPK